jgi:hypothetical protein
MPRVLIECPETHRMIYTGVNLNWNSFEAARFDARDSFACPRCGHTHAWSHADATVDEDGTGD